MKKIIFIVAAALAVLLTLLIVLVKYTPLSVKAIDELALCNTAEDVKSVYNKYKLDLTTINDQMEKEVDEEFLLEIRKKLSKLNLTESEIADCLKWLPPAPTSLNLIIVPDLSRRIIDEVNNPDQITNDTILLNYIWEAFEIYTKQAVNTKPRLIVDVADEGQANGQFRTLANDLFFDVPKHESPHLRYLWFDENRHRYGKSIEQLYSLAKMNPIGVDYWTFFRRNLSKHIQKSTLFDNYRNVLVIITDGYLEAEHKIYTGDWKTRCVIAEKIKQGNPIEKTVLDRVRIPDIVQKFPTLEILVLEVNERKKFSPQEPKDKGTTEDFDILKILWTEWFNRLDVKNYKDNFFIQRNDATELTKKEIERFLNM